MTDGERRSLVALCGDRKAEGGVMAGIVFLVWPVRCFSPGVGVFGCFCLFVGISAGCWER